MKCMMSSLWFVATPHSPKGFSVFLTLKGVGPAWLLRDDVIGHFEQLRIGEDVRCSRRERTKSNAEPRILTKWLFYVICLCKIQN